jgi:general secretion pathway protein E
MVFTIQGPPLDLKQLERAREIQFQDGGLARFAEEAGFASGDEAVAALATALGLDWIDLTTAPVDRVLLDAVPVRLIHRYRIFPVANSGDSLTIAIANPFDIDSADAVGAATGLCVTAVVASRSELDRLIRTHLGVGAETIDGLLSQDDPQGDVEVLEDLEWDRSEDAEMAQQASVVRLVNEILTEAVESRTSDIHLESHASGIKIRYRIDGVLQKQPAPAEINRFQAAIISRLKIMAKMNIAEKRLPQDGRIKLKVSGREVDIRVSVIPMLHGEGVVMRVLDKDAMRFSLQGIGMDDDVYATFGKLIAMPHGIILVTGPTGSGKTTTLYSALAEIKSEDTKIITTEDPIEYQLDGINQIQVHHKVGLTFAASLRSILRHDPDVILVGEIRDHETAENAIQASLTGHLVFSTLHTNDAAGAYMRLTDMGVESFLVSSTIEGIMAQRLVRTLCKECREACDPAVAELPEDFPREKLAAGVTLYRAVGCRACRQTGYTGRVGLYELLVPNDEIRELAHKRTSSRVIKQAAMRSGMRTLRHDGWNKVLTGRTTVDEVLRVAKAD